MFIQNKGLHTSKLKLLHKLAHAKTHRHTTHRLSRIGYTISLLRKTFQTRNAPGQARQIRNRPADIPKIINICHTQSNDAYDHKKAHRRHFIPNHADTNAKEGTPRHLHSLKKRKNPPQPPEASLTLLTIMAGSYSLSKLAHVHRVQPATAASCMISSYAFLGELSEKALAFNSLYPDDNRPYSPQKSRVTRGSGGFPA
ncbi:hypothetical protein GGQ74_000053 [Desulfobaculum xiamenense]|uniref:Uncharacterized protein n=1 Tax=Desulfobaculum xiamenense TaxID=995050 RepID=A0A846QJQ9_9BACT|nr:hypothetical protein [Desulfobaculum xiamenense]